MFLNALPALDQSIYHRAWNCTILLARAYDLPLMPHDWLCQSSAVGLSNLLLTRHLLTPLPTFGTSCRLLCAVLNQCLFSKRDSNLICFHKCNFWLWISLVFFICILFFLCIFLCHRAVIFGNGALKKPLVCMYVCMYFHLGLNMMIFIMIIEYRPTKP